MIRCAIFGALLLGAAAPAAAQVRPQPGVGDPHIQTVDFRPDQVVLLEAAVGYQVTIELAPDEQITNIAVGDSAAWQVTTNRAGDRLFVKLIQAGAATNMTVITNVRDYAFDLSPLGSPSPMMAYNVRFRYAPTWAMPALPAKVAATYRLSGAKALRPSMIADDGVRTYIEWPEDAALPAVYWLGAQGQETLANGNMRGKLYVIDSVLPQLVFRIDKQIARAQRRAVRAPR